MNCLYLLCLGKLNVYFTEVESNNVKKYVPRSVQVDLEVGVTNRVRLKNYTYISLLECTLFGTFPPLIREGQ